MDTTYFLFFFSPISNTSIGSVQACDKTEDSVELGPCFFDPIDDDAVSQQFIDITIIFRLAGDY